MSIKYVLLPDGSPILFPEHIVHSVFRKLNPISAGYVSWENDNRVVVNGESSSLQLVSKGEDAIFISKLLEKLVL